MNNYDWKFGAKFALSILLSSLTTLNFATDLRTKMAVAVDVLQVKWFPVFSCT